MTTENGQTEIDPLARRAVPAPTIAAGGPMPPIEPATTVPSFDIPVPTIASHDSSWPTPSGDLAEGEISSPVVGRYFIEKKLGQGGMGAVYLCRDRRLMDKRVVLKVLLGVGGEWGITKFLQEIEALSRPNHPGIVGILDAGELSPGKPFLVMEYICGGTLQDAITPGGIELQRAGKLIQQIGSALAAAHTNGILHRDLKPANIMLDHSSGEEKVRIIDFGIAKVHDSLVSATTVVGRFGTPVYMSPEQFRVERITAASDIYSMGAIAYEMVTGRAPFDPLAFQNLGEMYTAGLKVRPREVRPELPERAQQLILKALSLRSEHRFQNAVEFGDALAQSLSEGGAARVLLPSFRGLVKQLRGQGNILRMAAPVFVVLFITVTVVLVAGLIAPLFWGGYKQPEPKPTSEFGESALPITGAAAAAPRSSITYWLTVEKNKDPKRNPILSSGEETFDNQDRFKLSVLVPKFGNLYILYEGTPRDGTGNLAMIFPKPSELAAVVSGRTVQTTQYKFSGAPGTETIWIVWSSRLVTELEEARAAALKNNGSFSSESMKSVRELLQTNAKSMTKPSTSQDNDYQRTVFSDNQDVLVKRLELVHH